MLFVGSLVLGGLLLAGPHAVAARTLLQAAQTFGSVTAALQGNPELSTLAALVTEAGLGNTLDSIPGGVTLCAPDNDAFDALGAAKLAEVRSMPGSLSELLQVHAVPGKTLGEDVTDGLVAPTLAGPDLTLSFEVSPAGVFVTAPNGGATAEVTTADILAGDDSVVHIVSAVLVPGEADDMAEAEDVEPVAGGVSLDASDDGADAEDDEDGGVMRDDGRVDTPEAGEMGTGSYGAEEGVGGYGDVMTEERRRRDRDERPRDAPRVRAERPRDDERERDARGE